MCKRFIIIFLLNVSLFPVFGQTGNYGNYCQVSYNTGQCNQPGPSNSPGNFINDFINDFVTTGANNNINNSNSGCNGLPGNFGFYCNHYLAASPGQTITINIRSGMVYS